MPTRKLVTRYEDDLQRFPDRWHKVGLTLAVVTLSLLPFGVGAYGLTIANLAMVAVVGASGLMVLTGFTGQISLGHAAFMALGAYTAAAGAHTLHLPFYLLLPLAGLVAASVGLLVGPFALRLRGLYLAIVTLGLMFMVNHVLLALPSLTGGVGGISVPMLTYVGQTLEPYALPEFSKPLELGPLTLSFEQKLYFVFLTVATLVVLGLSNLSRSNLGRAMMAVRDHDLAAAVLGVNPAATKIIGFGLSAFFTGVAGAMFAFQQQYITVDPPFNLLMSVQYIAMIVLGGVGTTFGAVAGGVAFTVLSPAAEVVGAHIPLLNTLSSAQQATLLFSVVVMGFLLFEPLGLFGIWLRIKRYFVAWPFRY